MAFDLGQLYRKENFLHFGKTLTNIKDPVPTSGRIVNPAQETWFPWATP